MASFILPEKIKIIERDYYKRLELSLKDNISTALSRDLIAVLIRSVLDNQNCLKPNQNTWTMGKYKVQRKNGRYVLKMRQEEKDLVVVPWEDSFPIIWNCHARTAHMSILKTHEALRSNYVMESVCAEVLLRVCCCASFNKNIFLSVIEIPKNICDAMYTHLLLYEDFCTDFIQLKPIPYKHVNDIAIELIKIFCDVGPPSVIYSNIPNPSELLQITNQAWKQSKVQIHVLNRDNTATASKIILMMNDWLKPLPEGSKAYYYGWHVVQHILNNTKSSTDELSPFERAFPYLKKPENDGTQTDQMNKTINDHNDRLTFKESLDIHDKEFSIKLDNDPLSGISSEVGNAPVDTNISQMEASNKNEVSKDSNSDGCDDVEIIENKTDLIVVDDDNEDPNKPSNEVDADDQVYNDCILCKCCKNQIEHINYKCEACCEHVHGDCSSLNNPTNTRLCMPCADILAAVNTTIERTEDSVSESTNDNSSPKVCRIYD